MIKYYFLIVFFSFTNSVCTQSIYNEKKIRAILYNQYNMNEEFPEITSIHFYNNKKGRVLQIEFETVFAEFEIIERIMNSLAKVGQYSKTPLNNFIVINHYKDSDIPISYESNADCAINYFIKDQITKRSWMKDCLSYSITEETQNMSELNLRD